MLSFCSCSSLSNVLRFSTYFKWFISDSSHHAASESDDSSLNSTEDGPGHIVLNRRAGPIPSPIPAGFSTASRSDYYETPSQFGNVISGSVTTVPIEGQSSSAIQVKLVQKFINFKTEELKLCTVCKLCLVSHIMKVLACILHSWRTRLHKWVIGRDKLWNEPIIFLE